MGKERTIIDFIEGMTVAESLAFLNQYPEEKASLISIWMRFIEDENMPEEIRNMSPDQHLRSLLQLIEKKLIRIEQIKKKGDLYEGEGEYHINVILTDASEWEIETDEVNDYLKLFLFS